MTITHIAPVISQFLRCVFCFWFCCCSCCFFICLFLCFLFAPLLSCFTWLFCFILCLCILCFCIQVVTPLGLAPWCIFLCFHQIVSTFRLVLYGASFPLLFLSLLIFLNFLGNFFFFSWICLFFEDRYSFHFMPVPFLCALHIITLATTTCVRLSFRPL